MGIRSYRFNHIIWNCPFFSGICEYWAMDVNVFYCNVYVA